MINFPLKQTKIFTLFLLAMLTVFPLALSDTATAATAATQLNGIAGDKVNYLNWSMANGGSGTITYSLKSGSTTIYTGTDLSFTHSNLTNGTTYTYTVTSTDSTMVPSPVSNTSTLVPKAPTGGAILDAPYGNTHLRDTRWCPQNGGDKNWAYSIKNCDTGGGVISHFDSKTSSYAMFKLNLADSTNGSNQPLKFNRYQLYVAEPGKKLTFYKNSTDNQHYLTSTGLIYRIQVQAEPNDDHDYRYNWTGVYANQQYMTTASGVFNPSTVSGWKGYVIGNDVFSAQVSAVNVDYSSSWQYDKLTDHAIEGVSGTIQGQCATWDLACKIGAAFQNLEDGFQNLVISVLKGLGDMFIPDSDKISEAMNSYSGEFADKMGFLLYPFEFIGTILSSFNTSQGWCTADSCQKSFGQFMGGDLKINFLAVKQVTPTLWDWVLIFIRATTVIALFYMVRAKYMKVITT